MVGETPKPDVDGHITVDDLIHHTDLPHTPLTDVLDGIVRGVGNVVSWVWIALVLVIVTNVTLRYVFGEGRVEFEELQWHLYAIGFLVGLSYAVENDSHIRIDILHQSFSPRTKAWIEVIGILLFLIPYVMVVLIYAPEFIAYSYSVNEISDAPGGLPYRWAIKSMMFIGYALLLLAAISRLLRAVSLLVGHGRPGSVTR